MLVLRFVALAAGLFLLALGIAYLVTRNRRYLRIAWRTLQILLLSGVAFGLLYLFARVLVML